MANKLPSNKHIRWARVTTDLRDVCVVQWGRKCDDTEKGTAEGGLLPWHTEAAWKSWPRLLWMLFVPSSYWFINKKLEKKKKLNHGDLKWRGGRLFTFLPAEMRSHVERVCVCFWVFKEVQVMYRKPEWVSQNHIMVCSQTLTWTHLKTQPRTNANQTPTALKHMNTNVYRDTHKRNFNSSRPLTVFALITTSLGSLSFSQHHDPSLPLSTTDAFSSETRHCSAGTAQTIKSQGGKFWRSAERSGHFSERENKFFGPLGLYIHFLLWRRWAHVIVCFGYRFGW